MAQLTKEQRDEVEQIADECASMKLRRYTVRALIGFAILVAGGATATVVTNDQRSDADRVTQTRINRAVRGSCRRVNVLRAQSNLSDKVSYSILVTAGGRETKLAKIGPQAELHRRSADQFFSEATNLRVTPLTDCEKAVDHPQDYRTPSAGPIGDPRAGTIDPLVASIIEDSKRLLMREGRE